MSKFVDHILDAVRRDGAKAMEIFPAEAGVLVGFVDRIGMDVVSAWLESARVRIYSADKTSGDSRSPSTSTLSSHRPVCRRVRTSFSRPLPPVSLKHGDWSMSPSMCTARQWPSRQRRLVWMRWSCG
jgi:hypothetical protein